MCAHRSLHSINRNCLGKRKVVGSMLIKFQRQLFRYGKVAVSQNDHVKTSGKRQVKARISLACVLALLGPILQLRAAEEQVDLILFNGNIYTVNEKTPHAEAVAVKKDRIVFVGSNEEAKRFRAARNLDLGGKTLLPGLTDSHCHIFGIGERELTLNLEGTNTLEDFLAE